MTRRNRPTAPCSASSQDFEHDAGKVPRIGCIPKRPEKEPKHSRNGNCWLQSVTYKCAECGHGNLCDVCHEHDEPRGSCPGCAVCPCADCYGEDS